MAKETPDIGESVSLLCGRVKALLAAQALTGPDRRILIALAGVPGSGKSTISSALLKALPEHGIEDVTVLPMVCTKPTTPAK